MTPSYDDLNNTTEQSPYTAIDVMAPVDTDLRYGSCRTIQSPFEIAFPSRPNTSYLRKARYRDSQEIPGYARGGAVIHHGLCNYSWG